MKKPMDMQKNVQTYPQTSAWQVIVSLKLSVCTWKENGHPQKDPVSNHQFSLS